MPKGFVRFGDFVMPKAPNRWLVQCFAWGTAGPPQRRAWLVVSDAVSQPAGTVDSWAPQVAVLDLNRPGGHAMLGAMFDWDNRAAAPDGAGGSRLTALGPGGPLYAGAYFAARGSMGFHDPDPPHGRLTYTVAGWYAALDDDPFSPVGGRSGATPEELLAEAYAALEWLPQVPPSEDSPPPTPPVEGPLAGMVLHGAVRNLNWPGAHAPLTELAPKVDTVRHTLRLGQDAVDAAAALIDPVAGAAGREVFAGVLSSLVRSAEDVPQLGPIAHESTFERQPGGPDRRHHPKGPSWWELRPKGEEPEPERLPAMGGASGPTPTDEVDDVPPVIWRLLDRANRAAEDLAAVQSAHAALLTRQYDAWCRWTIAVATEETTTSRETIDAIGTLIDEVEVRRNAADKAVDQAKAALDAAIDESGLAVEAVAAEAPSLFMPSDPVATIQSADLNFPQPDEPDEPAPVLRASDALANAARLASLARGTLPPLGGVTGVEAVADLLCRELVLYDGSAPAALGAAPIQGDGAPDALALFGNGPAEWRPLLAVWQVRFTPHDEPDAGERIWTSQANAVEAMPAARSHGRAAGGINLAGWSPVERTVATQLFRKLDEEDEPLATAAADTLRAPLRRVGEVRFDGLQFARALLKPSVRLELPNPKAPMGTTVTPTRDAIDGRQAAAPPLGPLAPESERLTPAALGGGALRVVELALLDGFGRSIEIIAKSRPETVLPPRIAAPARLVAHWLDAGGAPGRIARVHGWLLHNYLDKSLAVYDAEGRPVGALLRTFGGVTDAPPAGDALGDRAFVWLPTPGDPAAADYWTELAGGAPPGPDYGLLDPVLAGWIRTILGLKRADGHFWMRQVLTAQANAVPAQPGDPATADLVGDPFALVTAGIGVALPGLPPVTPSQYRERGTIDAAPPLGEIGVRSGNLESPLDGLMAARWAGAPAGLMMPAGLDFSGEPLAGGLGAGPAPVAVGGGRAERALPALTEVQMLIDPRRPVTLRAGLLPQARLEPPKGLANQARHIAEIAFQVGPVLTSDGRPGFPAPSDSYGEWSWRTRPAISGWSPPEGLSDGLRPDTPLARPPRLADGWLTLQLPVIRGFFAREGPSIAAGAVATLVWDVGGAATLALFAAPATGSVAARAAGPAFASGSMPGETEIGRWGADAIPRRRRVVVAADTVFILRAYGEAGAMTAERALVIRTTGA